MREGDLLRELHEAYVWKVNAAVEAHQDQADKYDINVWALLGTAVFLAAYLGFVYRTSFREYREAVVKAKLDWNQYRLNTAGITYTNPVTHGAEILECV